MALIVTQHAIKRYRERLFDYTSSTKEIKNKLSKMACLGKRVGTKPAAMGNCYELTYQGISIVLITEDKEGEATIITCLGDTSFRNWIKTQTPNIIHGRILHGF